MKLSITVTGDTVDVINRVKDDYKYGGKASVLLMTALVSLLEREHQREIEAVALDAGPVYYSGNTNGVVEHLKTGPFVQGPTIDKHPDALAERNEELKGQLGNVTKVPEGTLTQDHFESTIAGVEPDIDYSNPTGDVVLEEPECTEEEAGNIKVEYTCPPNDTAAAREALTQGAAPEPPDEDEVF